MSRPLRRGPLVVVGDALLDIDLVGAAERLSPDAPVPVLDGLEERPRAGGAGLAATLAAVDGHDVVLVTALGADAAGERLAALLAGTGITVLTLPYEGPTPVKQRIRAAGQSLLRLDSGSHGGRIGTPDASVVDALAGAGAVLVSDYGRGVTAVPALRDAVAALPAAVPVVWDPHPRGARPPGGLRLVTPNRAEAETFADRERVAGLDGTTGLARIGRQAAGLVAAWRAQAVAVTLGERGALLSYGHGSPAVTPAPPVTATDPCGAGDRFAVSAASGLGSGLVTSEAVHGAVLAAADFVAAGGAASVPVAPAQTRPDPTLGPVERTRRAGGVVVATGGCFDLLHAGHIATLRAARALGDCLVVCLNSDESVRRLKGPGRPLVPAVDRARVLGALECVDDVVVFGEDTPVEVLRSIRPDVWAKGGDYAGARVPEAAALEEWGGQAVVLPYLEGRSTTRLVETAAARSAPVVDIEQRGGTR